MTASPDILPEELQPANLLGAYACGAFPMEEDGELWWFSPAPRGLLPLDERFHVSRSLVRTMRRGPFACTFDQAFRQVMEHCADRPEGTWIGPRILDAYTVLHELGFAHSVEAWPADRVGLGEPVGGLYGVSLGGAFFAESMFHRQRDAGKVALVRLVEHLRAKGFLLCDIQWVTPNLERFGAFEISGSAYAKRLADAIARPVAFA